MKNYIVIILGTLCFILLTLFTLRGVGLDSHKTKGLLYHYPNGLVANTGIGNFHMIGSNIDDPNKPQIKTFEKEESRFLISSK